MTPVVVDLEQRVAEREDLEAARIGQDRAVPAGEGVQPAELGDHVVAGPEVQVVGVAEDDLRADRAQLVRVEALDRPLRADRHERGRPHFAVRGAKDPGAGGAVGGGDLEAHRISIASPKE